ncbi:MAG: hypothetical protein ACLQAH_16065 [Limisphaerales bacterium]
MNQANDPSKQDQPAPSKASSGGTPASPAESGSGANRGWLLPLVVVLVVVAVCISIGLAMTRHTAKPGTETAPAAPAESFSTPATNAPPEAPATNATSGSNSPALVPPPLKLQGIVYDQARPWAIVNGTTVYSGDRVGDFRVKEISQNTITLEDTNGALKTLFLGR